MEYPKATFSKMKPMDLEALDKAVETGEPVRLFFVTGYQAEVIVFDYDRDVIICRKVDRDKLWLVYLDKICTIEV